MRAARAGPTLIVKPGRPTGAGRQGRACHERPIDPPDLRRTANVIIVSSVMFTFISYWRTAAVVLCDLASTAYYIGGIVEQSIGPAAPWFILAVMVFSYAVRSVYIESCTLFVRGGVYRVVREALGKFMAKLAVSALMFDYVLTGPISGVSAGQYILGLILESTCTSPCHTATRPGGRRSAKPCGPGWPGGRPPSPAPSPSTSSARTSSASTNPATRP